MIDFSGYTYAEILQEMLDRVDNSLDKRQGSLIQTALGPVAWYLEGLYILLAQMQNNAYAETATGQYLDYKAEERGLTRKPATPAVRQGIFDEAIPTGSQFRTISNTNSVIFVSGDLISAENGVYTYRMTCQTPGTVGNSYTGNILPITSIYGLTRAEIGETITEGTDEETDDALRARWAASFNSTAFGGNIASYRSEILSIDGVGAVQVYPAWQGGGTVLCSILDGNLTPAEAGLIETVQNHICPPADGESVPSADGYGYAPIGAAVTITTATSLPINIECTIRVSTGSAADYQQEIEAAIGEYIDEVLSEWGDALVSQSVTYPVYIYLARILTSIISVDGVVNVTGATINGSAADLALTETAALQQVPVMGTVTVHG